jgi:M6 family metalloprotease-like protein
MRPIVPVVLAALLCHGLGRAADNPLPASVTLPAPVGRLLADRSATLRAEAQNTSGRRLPGQKAPATLETIVISCDFADSLLLGRHGGEVPGKFPPPRQTDRHYAAHDSVFLHHKLQDVAAYFSDVSGGALDIRFTVHARAINLPQPMSWYGNHPTLGEQPVALAAAVVDSLDQEIDFTLYDTVVLVHAGAGEETDILGDSPEQIYSTYLNPDDFRAAFEDSLLAHPYLPAAGFAPGFGIDRVLVLPETEQQDPFGGFNGGFGSLGVYCFEFGLHLGMLSLSDFTPSGRPDSQGVGQYDLMGYGLFVGLGFLPPQPSPLNKLLMGWLTPYAASPEAGAVWALTPASAVAGPLACARVEINGQEYWLAEYRLQDPNGDRRFSFPGDRNGNGLPDFWDADSEYGNGTPTEGGKFDPATDTHEDLRGAEWDFAMSENNARATGELGAGSGVYVWHVDEAVIAAVFGGPTNLFNADPARKAVDLEEADGVQDLDTNEPSSWQLGGDDDSFRGEDNVAFGPDTRPDTRSNSGWPTGVMMSDFSDVVRDSAAYEVEPYRYPGYDYADTMTFRLSRAISTPDARLPVGRLSLPTGVDLAGSHLMAVDLDVAGGQEIVVADHNGGVWAFTGALAEFRDHDGDVAGTLAQRRSAAVCTRQRALQRRATIDRHLSNV